MPGVSLAFGDITNYPGKSENYIRYILGAYYSVEHSHRSVYLHEKYELNREAKRIAGYGPRQKPSMLTYSQAAALMASGNSDLMPQLNKLMQCFVTTMAPLFRAVEGEVPAAEMKGEEGFFSALLRECDGYPSGTIVFVRKTNYAEYFLLTSGWRIPDTNVISNVVYVATYPEEDMESQLMTTSSSANPIGSIQFFVSAVLFVGKALLGTVLSKLGTEALNFLFPNNELPKYFDTVFQKIKGIVGAVVTENEVSILEGTMEGTSRTIAIDYGNMKEHGYKKKELHDYLEKHINVVDFQKEVVAVLEKFQNASGFTVYLAAASIHLALLQEQCIQDVKVTDPYLSVHVKSITDYANIYIEYVERSWPIVLRARKNQVTIEEWTIMAHAGNFVYGLDKARYSDEFNGKKGKSYQKLDPGSNGKNVTTGKERAESARKKYQNGPMTETFKVYCGRPQEIVAKWKLLAKNPLPKPFSLEDLLNQDI